LRVTISRSVKSLGSGAFFTCTSLGEISVDPDNSSYSSADGVLFDKSHATLIQYPGNKPGTYTIPNTVTGIEDMAFFSCARLDHVTIPNIVSRIGASAFQGCANLTDVAIPASVNSIGTDAFGGCASMKAIEVDALSHDYSSRDGVLFDKTGLKLLQFPSAKSESYRVPDGVTSIADWTFQECSHLTGLTIPSSVASIGNQAFYGCTSLAEAYFEGDAPAIGANLFWNNYTATIYYVPGTAGWGYALGGRPTAPWKPQVKTGDGNFGVKGNGFGFTISWASQRVVVVEANTSPNRSTWFPVGTNTIIGGSSYFSDLQWVRYPACFYRLRTP